MLDGVPPAAVDRRWPWAVAGLAFLLTVAAVPLAVANGAHAGVADIYVGDAITGALVPAAGALILSHRPGNRIGWVLLSTAGLALSFFLTDWSGFGLHTAPGSLPAAAVAGWVGEIVWIPILAMLTLLPLWFPTGRVTSRAWLPLQVGVLGLFAVLLVACVLHPQLEDGTRSPLTSALPDLPPWVRDTITTAIVFSSLACLASVVVRYVRSSREERLRLRWFALAVAVAVAVTFLPGIPTTVNDVLSGLAMTLVAAAVVAAVLGGLYGLDTVVDRSLVYAITAAATYLIYVVVVAAGGALLPEAAGFLGAAAVAIAFAPARAVTGRAVDRLLHGRRSDPLAALQTVGARLDGRRHGSASDPAARDALNAVRESLRLPWAAVRAPDGSVVTEAGTRPATAAVHEVGLRAGGEELGHLAVALRPGETRADARDEALLDAVARVLAGAVHAGALADDLQRARERLVLVGEDERRRLHRDLHDGLGPVLSHAVLALDGVRHEAGGDLPGLTDLKGNLQDALADLRRLVQGLRPPALDDVGLAGALGKHVTLLRSSGPRVTLDVADLPPDLPAAVEVAAYRIATEALTNVTRHASATRCAVTVALVGDHVVVTVADDGVGVHDDAGETAGVGLRSLRDRAEELGGGLELTPGDPGTVVTARLPVRDA